jgi:transposase
VRLFAAGELSYAFVPSEADEHFRDLVRCVEDARKDLMRSRHRLSKFLLRRGRRFPNKAWTQPHERWLCQLHFEDAPSQATFLDYLSAVQALVQRRRALIGALEEAVPGSSHSKTVARLHCFRGIDTLTAAGLCAEVGDFTRFAKPALLSGFLGVVPSEYTSDDQRVQSQITRQAHHTPAGRRVFSSRRSVSSASLADSILRDMVPVCVRAASIRPRVASLANSRYCFKSSSASRPSDWRQYILASPSWG